MDKTELKKLLKPLIKECLQESLFENGFLSKIITEVVVGLNPMMVESKATKDVFTDKTKQKKEVNIENKEYHEIRNALMKERQEKASKMMEKTGFSNIFNNIKENDHIIEESHLTPSKNNPEEYSSLNGIAPNDPGVNINGILGLIGGKRTWTNQLKKK